MVEWRLYSSYTVIQLVKLNEVSSTSEISQTRNNFDFSARFLMTKHTEIIIYVKNWIIPYSSMWIYIRKISITNCSSNFMNNFYPSLIPAWHDVHSPKFIPTFKLWSSQININTSSHVMPGP